MQVFTWGIRMRCDRQMFPLRQLLLSARERSERRGCIWFTPRKEKKREGWPRRKRTEEPHYPTFRHSSCSLFLSRRIRRDARPRGGGLPLSSPYKRSPHVVCSDRVFDKKHAPACNSRSKLKFIVPSPRRHDHCLRNVQPSNEVRNDRISIDKG